MKVESVKYALEVMGIPMSCSRCCEGGARATPTHTIPTHATHRETIFSRI